MGDLVTSDTLRSALQHGFDYNVMQFGKGKMEE
jgi:hypothetical protein